MCVNLPTLDESIALSALTSASRTATTLSVTWSAGYPKCYSFTVSHYTQDGSTTVTQPADSDTSHTLTSLQPGTTYRIEVEAVRKGDGADGQRAKVVGNFTTDDEGGEGMVKKAANDIVEWLTSSTLLSQHQHHRQQHPPSPLHQRPVLSQMFVVGVEYVHMYSLYLNCI